MFCSVSEKKVIKIGANKKKFPRNCSFFFVLENRIRRRGNCPPPTKNWNDAPASNIQLWSSFQKAHHLNTKIFYKILTISLTHFLENSSLINTRQHGFRRNCGTNTALATFYGTIANSINNELKVDIVLADVSKAFDKVWQYLIKVQTSKHSNTCMLHENSVKLFRQQGCINQDWIPCWIPLLD